MSILALDYGAARTGVAVSPDKSWVFERDALVFDTTSKLVAAVGELVKREDVATIVVGYPVSLKGDPTSQTAKTDAFVAALRSALPEIEVVQHDERMTSQQAESLLRDAGKTQDTVDSLSAKLLLENYLQKHAL